MNEEITASVPFDEPTMVAGYRWHRRQHRAQYLLRALLVLAAAFVAFVAVGMIDEQAVAAIPLPFSLGFVVVVAVGAIALRLWLDKRRFVSGVKSSAHFGQTIVYQSDASQMKVTAPNLQSTLAWKAFPKAVETPEGVLLYQQKYLFNWLPKTAFTTESDYARFLGWLSAETKHSKIG